ncbi:MAG: hypothetical protein HOQ11_01545 [Gemmatimonadaceae bacterium]|nr:hypothetical protein [Gemmatimonadaceae bacterium]NUQ93816.1 hypothetical protein [Gemmatimonadaceae bacterium]NUR19230.1 hypothetical protein [Gemmatimonadaceae bacterium]NUS96073.1 hypothetical protein [Gemmatimonadaceae bacterium]
MMRSRHRRGIGCFAASALAFLQGCYYYAPTTLPVAMGSEVRIEGAAVELHEGPTIMPGGTTCRVRRVTGVLASARGDTLSLQPVTDLRRVSPRGSCARVSRVTLVADAQSTRVAVPKFSGAKTALSIIGVTVFVAAVGSVLVLESDHSARSAPPWSPALGVSP